MNSLEELNVIRDKMKDQIAFRGAAGPDKMADGYRMHVLVCGGTGCTP